MLTHKKIFQTGIHNLLPLIFLFSFAEFAYSQTKEAEILSLNPYFYETFETTDNSRFFNDLSGNSTCEWTQDLRPNLVSGVRGNAYSFEGIDTYLRAHSYGNYKVGNLIHSTGFSLSFWINLDYDYSRDNVDRIFDQQGVFEILFFNGMLFRMNGHQHIIANTDILNGNWHHIAVSIDYQKPTDNITYYVDNVLTHTATHVFDSGFSRADQRKSLHIGSRHGGSWHGNYSLDEVAFFNRPISTHEVNQLYQVNQVIEQNPQEISLQINDGKTQVSEGVSTVINLNASTNMNNLQTIDWQVVQGNASIQSNGTLNTSILMNDGSNYQHAKIRLRVSNGIHEKYTLINVVRVKEKASNARSLSDTPPPGVHPRILFGPDDLPEMRSRYNSVYNIKKGYDVRVKDLWDLPKQDRDKWHYTLMSYHALMENDTGMLNQLSADFTEFIDSFSQNYIPNYDDRFADDISWDIGFTYDFLYNSMDHNQRSKVRALIAKMIAHRIPYGGFSDGSTDNVLLYSTNFTTFTNRPVVAAMAIEGEEGAMPKLLEINEDILRNFLCKYGILDSGFAREGWGYVALGMRNSMYSCLIHARRGENFYETSNFYKSLEIGFREQQPWSLGDMYSHHDGQIFENGCPTGDMFWVAKYMYPDDRMVDYHVQSFTKNRVYGYACTGIGLMAFGMDSIPDNTDPGAIGVTLQYPTSAIDYTRGIINTRNKWGDDMVRLDFECRMDVYHFGHMHADRNMFTLSGYDRQWISDSGYEQTMSEEHATILIDGQASDCVNRPFWPSAPGVLLRYEDEEEHMIAQGDATFFYNYGTNRPGNPDFPYESVNKTWGDFSYAPNYVLDPMKNTNVGSWTRVDTVEKALRTVAFKKGDYPFALIVDDIKKDDQTHEFEWVANLPHSHDYYNRYNFGYEILSQTNEELLFKYDYDTMENAPQLQIKLLDAAGTPTGPLSIEERDMNGPIRNVISIKRENVVSSNFKVLLYPHRKGFPLPQTSWNDDKTLLTVRIADETTYVEFSEDNNGCTVMNIIDQQTACTNYGNGDADSDGVCDAVDICDGFDDTIDIDNDGIPSGCDICPNDPLNDLDGDGVCGENDICQTIDDNLRGTICDDGDPCTDLSIYDANCNCAPKINYALSGVASMSSVYANGFDAQFLNDGELSTGLAATSNSSPNEWMQIDLNNNKDISEIVIMNRTNCCSDRLSNAYVLVSDTPFPNNTDLNTALSNATFTYQLGDTSQDDVVLVDVGDTGRYVRLQKSGNNVSTPSNDTNVLNILELQIFGNDTNQDTDKDGICGNLDVCPNLDDALLGTPCNEANPCNDLSIYDANCECMPKVNHALNGVAQMSSTGFGLIPENLNDGNLNSLSSTYGLTDYDWMDINLGQSQAISEVVIRNRSNCCKDRLNNAYLLISNSPFPANDDLNTALANATFTYQIGDVSDKSYVFINAQVNGQYVRLQKSGDNVTNYLNIQEIQVLGEVPNNDADNDTICDDNDVCPNFDNNLIGTICDDGSSCTTLSVYDANCNCVPISNYARLGKSLISSGPSANDAYLIDGIIDNNTAANTADNSPHEWVQVDLGTQRDIKDIIIWNRTDCCQERLSNAYLMLANTPFPVNYDLNAALSNAQFTYQIGNTNQLDSLLVNVSQTGRYVRIQKSGNNLGGHSLSILELEIRGDTPQIDIQLQAYLEGVYDNNTGQMSTNLQSRGLLPGQTPVSPLATPTPAGQPYSIAPWNYAGTEGINWTDADYTGDETDWVLISFRTGTAKSTEVAQTAALLMKDGTIELVNRCPLSSTTEPLYIVLEHRNHIGVMTPQPVDIVNGILTYDFRTSDSYRDPTSFGQKQLSNGKWAMFAGDANQLDFPSFDVNGTDKTEWFENNGVFDYYLSPDFNLDGDVNGQDKSLWFENNGISSRVPK